MQEHEGGFLHPEQILEHTAVVKPGMKVADFGCGAGHFTLALARAVGSSGTVFAFDVLKSALNSVESAAKREGLFQIKTAWSDLESIKGSKLRDGEIDAAFAVNVLYQVPDKDAFLKEAWRVLRGKGFLVVVDWDAHALAGPPMQERVAKEELKRKIQAMGFDLRNEFAPGKFHYGLLFQK